MPDRARRRFAEADQTQIRLRDFALRLESAKHSLAPILHLITHRQKRRTSGDDRGRRLD